MSQVKARPIHSLSNSYWGPSPFAYAPPLLGVRCMLFAEVVLSFWVQFCAAVPWPPHSHLLDEETES